MGSDSIIGNATIVATLTTDNIGKARDFFSKKLGLKETEATEQSLSYESPKGALMIYMRPGTKPSEATAVHFTVDDVAATVKDLRAKGVKFEEYKEGPFKTTDGVATNEDGSKAAWAKDPSGHIIGFVTM